MRVDNGTTSASSPHAGISGRLHPYRYWCDACTDGIARDHPSMTLTSADDEHHASALRAVLVPRDIIVRGRRILHYKATFTALVFAGSYSTLVFLPVHWGVRLAAAVLLVHAVIAVATGIMHDANHGSFAETKRTNRLFAYSADLLGASSWLWRINHNVAHHHWTNVVGHDDDIELAPFARLAPTQQWRPWHRYQHVYLWFLYGFLQIKWLLVGDFLSWWSHRHALRQRSRRFVFDSIAMVVGKLVHCTWAIVIPMLFHPAWQVLVFYLVCSWLVGFALAVIFQLAHCVDGVDFIVDAPARLTGDAAFTHQLATTMDFDTHPKLLQWYAAWLLGGLDHQVEHHLAPRLPHTVYRLVARRVDALCAERGWQRLRHPSFAAALGAHVRHLYRMGRPAGA